MLPAHKDQQAQRVQQELQERLVHKDQQDQRVLQERLAHKVQQDQRVLQAQQEI